MKEVKLTIDGKEVQLTDEQLRMLEIEPEKKRKNPFGRVAENEYYYCIKNVVGINRFRDRRDNFDNVAYRGSNYFNDEQLANQVALHQLFYRKLLKFAYDNECEDTAEWDGKNSHWAIRYDDNRDKFCPYHQDGYKARDVYFSSEEGAERAIKEVVEPFMKKHPDFVW